MGNKKIEDINGEDIKNIIFFDDGTTARLYYKDGDVFDFEYKIL